jgi:hypothetical protein
MRRKVPAKEPRYAPATVRADNDQVSFNPCPNAGAEAAEKSIATRMRL